MSSSTLSTSQHSSPSTCYSASGEDDDFHVRFVESCTLIPPTTLLNGNSRSLVQMTTKQVHLPRIPSWVKHTSHSGASHSSPRRSVSEGDSNPPPEDEKVMRIVLPKFHRSRSHHRHRTASQSPTPLSPCLIHRGPSSSPDPATRRHRRASLPPHLSPGTDEETIPLRTCCRQCFAITEEALRDPDWVENFSQGAKKLRKSYCAHEHDNDLAPSSPSPSPPSILSPSDSCREKLAKMAIKVDEIDKMNGQQTQSSHLVTSEDGTVDIVFSPSPHNATSFASSSSTSPPPSPCSPLGCAFIAKRLCSNSGPGASQPTRSSPIYELEEDESQLFPLPSPRRTPSSSPSHTPPDESPTSSTSNLSVSSAVVPPDVVGRRSPLSSEILVDPTTPPSSSSAKTDSTAVEYDDVDVDILPSKEGLTRKDSHGQSTIESPVPQSQIPHILSDVAFTESPVPIGTDSKNSFSPPITNGSADEIPQAFLDSYRTTHTVPISPQSPPHPPSSLPPFIGLHKRRQSSESTVIGSGRRSVSGSPERSRDRGVAIGAGGTSERPGSKPIGRRRSSFLGDVLKGVGAFGSI